MSSVGKKKKRIVYRRKKSKSLLFPLLVVGGVAFWYFTRNKQDNSGAVPVSDQGLDTGVSPVIVADNAQVTALQSAIAVQDRAALVYYDPQNEVRYKQMNDAETIAAYNYFFGYLTQGKKLYQYPNETGIYPDGGWDTALYNSVMSLRAKYGIYQ